MRKSIWHELRWIQVQTVCVSVCAHVHVGHGHLPSTLRLSTIYDLQDRVREALLTSDLGRDPMQNGAKPKRMPLAAPLYSSPMRECALGLG